MAYFIRHGSRLRCSDMNYETLKAKALKGRTPADRLPSEWGVFERDRLYGLDGWKNGVKLGLIKGEERIRIACKWYGVLGDMGSDDIFHFHEDAKKFSHGVLARLFNCSLSRRQGVPKIRYWEYSFGSDWVWLHPGLQLDLKNKKLLNIKADPVRIVDKVKQKRIQLEAKELYTVFYPLYHFISEKTQGWVGHAWGYHLLEQLENREGLEITEEFIHQLRSRWNTPEKLKAAYRRRMYLKHNVVTYKEIIDHDDKNDTAVTGANFK